MKIKIGHQRQADKPIYLLRTGIIECGSFIYTGRYKNEYENIFKSITSLCGGKSHNAILDVSNYRFWDAISICDEFLTKRFQKSISSGKIQTLARETQIRRLIEPMIPEFRRSVSLRWRKIFLKSDQNLPDTPKKAWQIL